jgi:hypothetical protein
VAENTVVLHLPSACRRWLLTVQAHVKEALRIQRERWLQGANRDETPELCAAVAGVASATFPPEVVLFGSGGGVISGVRRLPEPGGPPV